MFSFGIGMTGGPQFYIWKDNDPYSRSDVYSNSVSYAKLSKLRPFAYYLTINLKGDDIYVTYSASENSAILRVTLVPDGRIELLLWQEINNDWLSLWHWPSTYCEFYSQCSPFSSCDPKGSQDHCKCLPGFQPKVQQERDMRNWTGGTCVRQKALRCDKDDGFLKLDYVGSDLYIRLHDRDLVENVKKSVKFTRKKTHPIIIAVAAVSIGLLGVLCGYFIWRKNCGKQERIEKTCTGMSTSFEIGKIQGNSASKVSNLLDFFSSSLFY
ncbi:hypothetical protein OIU84_017111 [Salix udensis]|uniref:S-locus glycoprotein domain-containing protein n=1 Tax=Salix udensis TaxID=889485 RepID=A0AAD6L2D9_9ROSI|nr:hypothetical protein OIU84_017111 [Salix udensis]